MFICHRLDGSAILGAAPDPKIAKTHRTAHDRRVRTLRDLVDRNHDAWPAVEAWCEAAKRPVAILERDQAAAEATLLAAQVTTRSTMGAIAYSSGGLAVDGGWLRILGSGHPRMGGGLREWNESLGGTSLDPPLGEALLVAYDAIGGFFALNGGRWPDQARSVRYLAPDTHDWSSLEVGYSGLVEWAMSERLDDFYKGLRWPGWETDVAAIGPDAALSIYPPLGFEKDPIAERDRRAVPARELWSFHHDLTRQVADLPPGGEVRFKVVP